MKMKANSKLISSDSLKKYAKDIIQKFIAEDTKN
jgi:hypothetical protein